MSLFYDPKGSRVSRSQFRAVTSTASGTQNAWAPGINGHTVVFWDGSGGSLTVNGIDSDGVAPGTILIFRNTATSGFTQASFLNNSGSAAVGDKILNGFTGIATPVFNLGYAHYFYDGTNWQLYNYSPGQSVNPSFSAGDYTAQPSGTWTVASGDASTRLHYTYKGLIVMLYIGSTTVARNGADPTQLRIAGGAWSAGLTAKGNSQFPCIISDNGTKAQGYATIALDTTVLNIQRVDGAQFANSTDNTSIWANFEIEAG